VKRRPDEREAIEAVLAARRRGVRRLDGVWGQLRADRFDVPARGARRRDLARRRAARSGHD